jgi:N-acyl-D-amino-acid deacylase
MRTLAALLSVLAVTAVRADEAPGPAVKTAVEKAVKRIETGITNYPKHRQCFSCHHQAMAVFSLTAAKERGFAVDDDLLKTQITFSLKTFRNKSQIAKGHGVGGEVTSAVYALQTFAAAQHSRDETTDALVEYLLVRQHKDGSWPIPAFGDRPPTMGSLFTNVGLAISVLKHYGSDEEPEGTEDLQKRIDAALDKARAWLKANEPASTEDKVFHLRGLVDAGIEAKDVTAARERLLKDQRKDGSWAQLPDREGDAYATATVLVALRKAGLDASHEAYQKGVKYLLDTQKEDGAWIVQTRSKPLQPFFDNGDPGGKSQFISFAATGWAVLALLETVPIVPADGKKAP